MFLRSFVLVDLKAIENNYKIIRSMRGVKEVIAVVKADAYGHGARAVSERLYKSGCRRFAVATAEEGIELRKCGIGGEIIVLGYTPPEEEKTLVRFDLTQTLVSREHAEGFCDKDLKVQIAIDTGMKRIGFDPSDKERTVSDICRIAEKLELTGIYSHFCAADDKNEDDFSKRQADELNEIFSAIKERCGNVYAHISNSAGALRFCGGTVRAGNMLYGLSPFDGADMPTGIKAALKWKSVICRVEKCLKGESVGYGRRYIADKDTLVATVCTGYADGYPRAAAYNGSVLVRGKRARIIGNICMDCFMIDVGEISGVKAGDEVTLIGGGITAEEIAKRLSTINYEIVSRIGARVGRKYC